MAEDHIAGASRYGPYSRTIEEIRAAQGRIRAASARQRRLAASMRVEAVELRAQHPRSAAAERRGGQGPATDARASREVTVAGRGHAARASWRPEPVPGEYVKRTAPSRAEAIGELRREVTGFAQRVGACDIALEGIALAVSEALTNVVVHAYAGGQPGPMSIKAWSDGDGHLVVLVSDEGTGLVSRGDSPGLGLGIRVMAEMADDVQIATAMACWVPWSRCVSPWTAPACT